ncbi:hypothetical protein [Enterovibrio nigricans]|uniref:Uncharacterized protein n=1 Tax=Enterovibrio nigricans DSM 22720 TaxID=1121868 RepID=A0A1T4UPJ6_9GAMM|nr:hypothetical protein [Enterovibrio nigricans]SKA54629.1 hypothetical protein SAMN02745132_02181 [Enterovibrio nigricans DSM 22720]
MLEPKRLRALELSAERKELVIGVWGIDPSLNMALSFAVSEGLIAKTSNGGFQITDKGDVFINESKLISDFENDFKSIFVIGKRITEKMVESAAKRWVDEV